MLSDCDEYNSDMPDLEEEEEDPSESTHNTILARFTKRQAKMARHGHGHLHLTAHRHA